MNNTNTSVKTAMRLYVDHIRYDSVIDYLVNNDVEYNINSFPYMCFRTIISTLSSFNIIQYNIFNINVSSDDLIALILMFNAVKNNGEFDDNLDSFIIN